MVDYEEVVLTGSGDWTVPDGITNISIVVVGGGGGAGTGDYTQGGGGGGAGGLIHIDDYDISGYGSTISYSVGGGGPGANGYYTSGYRGSNSTFGNLTADGGGGGASYDGDVNNNSERHGGSGGAAGNATQSSTNDGYSNTGFGHDGYSGYGGGGGAGSAGQSSNGGDGMNVFGRTLAEGGSVGSSASGGTSGSGDGGGSEKDSNTQGGSGGSGTIIIRYAKSIYAISGTVKLAGSPLQGAIVRLIRQSDDTYVGETTSDSNGEYEFTDLNNEEYHVTVEYEDGSGNLYNDYSYPFVIPHETQADYP